MNRVLRIDEMSIQDRIDNERIASRFKKDWQESDLKEFTKDFQTIGEELNKILGGRINNKIAFLKNTTEEKYYNLMLFTQNNEYSIVVKPGYMGCILSSRYREPLEDWTRGNDLSDGECTKETLYHIFADILYFELVPYENQKQ